MLSHKDVDQAKQIAEFLAKGDCVIFSGAGLSTESGLADFRSKNGLWKKHDPSRYCSVNCLEYNYDEFLEFYKARLMVPENVKPNIGHQLIAKWEAKKLVNGVITQNIDGLHQAAGSKIIAELHGGLEPIFCHRCGTNDTVQNFINGIPCKKCGGHLRTSIVLFGESLPQKDFTLAGKLTEHARTMIVVGSSLTVSPANMFPQMVKNKGATLIIINRDETALDYLADIVIHSSIGETLSAINNFL
ncbi:MAG: NAD-dependent deacylase [Synergistaceae bacterium]|nr:NAD-dependent deacylase [Synergistaceae bacterium]